MDADDVIDSYVHDVARRLPMRRRNDVAFELRALLSDELRARAEEADRPADHDLAVEMLRAHGRPTETAIRYYEPFTIILPSDTWSFLVATVAGSIVISLLAPSSDAANIAGLAWLGLLVIGFGIKSLVLRRRPDAFPWKPHQVSDPDAVSTVGNLALAAVAVVLLVVYVAPGPVIEAVAGRWISANRFDYTTSFTHPLRMPWLAGALVIFAALQLVIASRSHWSSSLRWIRMAVAVIIGTQLGWHSRYGQIFQDSEIDEVAILTMGLAAAIILIGVLIELYRELCYVRPAAEPGPPPVNPDSVAST